MDVLFLIVYKDLKGKKKKKKKTFASSLNPLPPMEISSTSKSSHALGRAVQKLITKIDESSSSSWYTPHMAAAARAIHDRIPLVDLVLQIRDARIPSTSAFELAKQEFSNRGIVVLNKADLADRFLTERWVKHFEAERYVCCGVNAHNKESIKWLLNLVQNKIRKIKGDERNYTASVLLTGIPNVGKSSIANAMHQIGRISAAEKGKLKHALVSPHPGGTTGITSYKIASHPNIYLLDSPGILYPRIADEIHGCKLALTGAINDSFFEKIDLANYLLFVLNSGMEYKHWEKIKEGESNSASQNNYNLKSSSPKRKRKQYPSDHTQDFIVREVRRTLYETISNFKGCLENEIDLVRLLEVQIIALAGALKLPVSGEDSHNTVASKLLNLYRTGRLGSYTLDLPSRL